MAMDDLPRESCLVSGTKNKMKKAPIVVKRPKKTYVPHFMCASISGVTCPMMKLFCKSLVPVLLMLPGRNGYHPVCEIEGKVSGNDHGPQGRRYNSLELAPSAIPFALTLKGQTSATLSAVAH